MVDAGVHQVYIQTRDITMEEHMGLHMDSRATLCLLIRDKGVFLGLKARKIGAGKWNAFGGMIEPRDGSIEAAAVREVLEETGGVQVRPEDLESVGCVRFHFSGVPKWHVHLFVARQWTGEMPGSAEMSSLTWFPFNRIPYANMMPADCEWIPLVLAGKRIRGKVYYNADATKLEDFTYEEILANDP